MEFRDFLFDLVILPVPRASANLQPFCARKHIVLHSSVAKVKGGSRTLRAVRCRCRWRCRCGCGVVVGVSVVVVVGAGVVVEVVVGVGVGVGVGVV